MKMACKISDEGLQRLIEEYSDASPIDNDVEFRIYLALKELEQFRNTRTEPEPRVLTVKELKQSHGKPIFIINLEPGDTGYWAIGDTVNERGVYGITLWSTFTDDFGAYELYGIAWLAYDRPPKE